jgi:ribosome-associated heat shock protein Hsp15
VEGGVSAGPSLRIDKLLWFLRLVKTRTLAQRLVAEGHVRRNGARIVRAHEPVAAGDVLAVPLGRGVRVIEVLALPARRGPASEAQACYRALDASRAEDGGLDDDGGFALAAAPPCAGKEGPQP